MSLENIPKPQISKDYNRQAIRLTMVAVGLIILLAVGNAVYKSLNPKVNVEQPAKEEVTSNETITDEDTMGGQKYYDKNKKENVSNINASSNVESNNNIENHQSQYVEQNYGYDKGELLRAYYAKLIQEEEQARSSGIGFSTESSSGQNNGSNNSGYGNNQNNIYPQGNFPDQYAQQNMQEQKKDFLENAKQSKFYNSYQEEMPISKYEVMAGTFIPATLITGINSDLPSKSVAVVRENVYDSVTGNHLLIPKGTKIIGIYDSGIAFGQDRLLIVWQRLIFPNGKYIGLDNMGGIDLSGYAGFTGKVNNHFLKLLQAVVLSSAMGAGSAIVTDNDNDDWRSEAGKGAGQVILDFGNKMGEKILNRQPTIEIKQGYRFNIMVHSDLVLTPYGE
ncbi:MAG: TrbI/VirB10 family protein [Fusobacterium varium]|uniref:TrbI/VirB10 family protein n=1 Tax=Fusobacterium varium TaxID=856 RepID=UPI00242D8070|nr:TrbI/VirB10 family protein [Fusobacterium varium]MCF0171879.1 TrbI/VirB10 family protein [Fusobacterium varium]